MPSLNLNIFLDPVQGCEGFQHRVALKYEEQYDEGWTTYNNLILR